MKKWIRIIAMSKTLSEVKRELGSKDALQFAHHCAKLSICRPNDINIEHWKKELYGFCFGIQQIKIKPNNKWISKKLIDEYYFNAYCDFEDTYALALNDAWQELRLNNTYSERNKLNDNRLFNQYINEGFKMYRGTYDKVLFSMLKDINSYYDDAIVKYYSPDYASNLLKKIDNYSALGELK